MNKFLVLVLLGCSIAVQAQTSGKPITKSGGPAVQAQKLPPVDEVTLLRARVKQLEAKVAELKRQNDALIKDAQAAKANMPRCSADLRTSSSALGSRECAPYACDSVVGTCLMSCATTDDCTPGYLCDIPAGRCVNIPR